jgi:ssDNA-binding Zn-finger/Zn-ribbon topoisomerase 1
MPTWIGRFGPFMKCATPECSARSQSLPMEVVTKALKSLPVACSCGSPLKIARGRSLFVGCSNYPECRNIIPWKDFRAQLRDVPKG